MSWRKCPICNGKGKIINTTSSDKYDICQICKGNRIISDITGLPPDYSDAVILDKDNAELIKYE